MKKVFILLAIVFLLTGCADRSEVDAANNRPQAAPTVGQGSSGTEPFALEHVGTSGLFDYYRDTITDVLYLSATASSRYPSKALTVMLDPESGLPLTYTRYKELYIQTHGEDAWNAA